MIVRYSLYLTFLFVMICVKGFTQSNEYYFKNLSTSDGLSQSSVIAIHQDNLGQIWLGTRDGLNKYNGKKFTVYKNNTADSLSISNNDILAIDEDVSGNIWIGTFNGLNCYNPISNTFKTYFHSNASYSLSDNQVWTIKAIEDEIWVGTKNGLSVYNKTTGRFLSSFKKNKNPESLPDNFILKILQTKSGDIWIGTSNGLCKLIKRDNNNFYFKNYTPPIYLQNNGNDLYVQDIYEDDENNIWVATRSNGLFKYDKAADKLISFINKKNNPNFDVDFRSISVDKHGDLWLGAYSGLYILKDKKLHQTKYINTNLGKIKSIYLDKKGSVWVGTYYNGINFWDETNSNFTNLTDNKDGLSFSVVSSVVSDFKENIYFSTEGGGITMLNNNLTNANYINVNNTKGLSSDHIKTLFLDNEDLWIGTYHKGVSIYNTKSKKIDNKKISHELMNLLDKKSIYAIKKSSSDIVWLGTFDAGLLKYSLKTKTFKRFENEEKNTNSISNNNIRTLLIDSKNQIWVGTLSGLNLISPYGDEEEIQRFFFDKEKLSGKDILTVFEDSKGNIWVGIRAEGLYKFNGKTFEKIEIKNRGSEVSFVHAVIEDKNKNLWLSSNSGIVKYNPYNKSTIIYSQGDGLISNEFNTNSSLKFDDNRFYFGGPRGVSFFNPNNIFVNNYAPQVLLTDFKIKNETVKVNSEDGILEQSIAYTKSVKLSYDKANFSINYSIPNFVNSNNNQYSYRLVGLEDEWTTTQSTEATFTIQNAGIYLFEVKGANNDGIWNTSPTILKIIVKPAPWKSIWALIFYAFLIGFALYLLGRIIKSKAKLKHELQLEHSEAERNKEIHAAKLQFFTNISHEFRTPLTLILGPLQQILSEYKGSNILYKKLLVIESSANHLLQLINRLMDFRKLENNQFSLEAAEGNIVKFLKEIFLSFSEFAKDGNYTYNFNTSNEEIWVYYDRYKLERVFYNLISNAFRYTPKGGMIAMNIVNENNQISIEIEDSGVGISEEYVDKVFDRFFEVSIHNNDQKNYNKGTGIGLSIAKNIVNLHKGTISVKNKIKQGVIFKVTLPIGNSHLLENEIKKDFVLSDDVSQYVSQLKSEKELLDQDLDNLIKEGKRHTILLVEDNKELRSFMKSLLKNDYNIIEAENGKVALKKALKYVPDLIVSDVIMPEMVGTELCSKIKENIQTSHIPVILLTARTSLIYKFEGLESGADDYISKPFNLKEFKLRINNILESKERLKELFLSKDNLTPSDIVINSLDEQLLKKAFEIVDQNISKEKFDIADFAKELGLSRTMLFTKMKAWANITPNEFIIEMRMKRAVKLLEQGEMNISEVGYEVGFKDPKYFSKSFNKKFQLSPTQFKNKFSE